MKTTPARLTAPRRASAKPATLAALAAAAAALAPCAANASDSGPLLDILARKGVITAQEAEDLRAELTAEDNTSLFASIAKGKATQAIKFSGRLQVQYDGFRNGDSGASPNSHFFLRRVYIGIDADLAKNFSASFNYDFAASSFDKLFINWSHKAGSQEFSVDAGLRKVNLGFEETTSSGALESVERSAVTRYFAEDNNGRRLGGASYRIGLFFDANKSAASGKTTGLFYGAALTNPERISTAANVTNIGNRVNNTIALWANAGYSGKISDARYIVGAGLGWLPGQGGTTGSNVTTESCDLYELSVYGQLKVGDFTLKAEVLAANSEKDKLGVGSKAGQLKDTTPWGFWVQPSFRVLDDLELVARYSYLDSDARGVRLSDGVRNAPAAQTAKAMHEWYAGINYYIFGNDVKFQLGYAGGRAVRPSGSTAKNETAHGVRSQLQINF